MTNLTTLDDIKHLLADIRSNVKLDEGLSYRVEDAISILETGYSAFHCLPEPIEDAPTQGVEGPRKEAREREGDTEHPEGRFWREQHAIASDIIGEAHTVNAALKAKVKSLEARTTELAQELDDWRNREAACCPEDTPFEDEIKALRAKLRALEATPREANQGMLEVVDFLEFVANTFEGKSLGNRARNVLAALSRPNGDAGAAPRGGEKEKE